MIYQTRQEAHIPASSGARPVSDCRYLTYRVTGDSIPAPVDRIVFIGYHLFASGRSRHASLDGAYALTPVAFFWQ